MKIRLEINVSPLRKLDVYKSLDCAEEFMNRLLASDEAKRIAKECGVEPPDYDPSETIKLRRALGFARQSDSNHTFSCWERDAMGQTRKIGEFTALAGRDGAAEFNGNIAREWKAKGEQATEEQAGVHLLFQNGNLIKTLWIEACRC